MMTNVSKKKRSSLSKQVIAIIVLAAVVISLVGTLIVVNIVSALRKFPYDGRIYYIKREKDESGSVYYIMTDENKNPLESTSDGYFIVHDGTLIAIDQDTGRAKEYIRPDTEGIEQLGINDRVLMFPHTAKSAVQSVLVSNGKGEYVFYRMRTYEDTDKVSYSCMLRGDEYILMDENGDVYSKDADGLYTLRTGNKISIDEATGAVRSEIYYDFDGKEYTVGKNGEGKYSLYLGSNEIAEKTTKNDVNGETVLYDYFVTDFGTLVSVDGELGTLGICAFREFDSKGEKYTPYYFILRDGKYLLCDKDGALMTETAVDDADYYATGRGAYVSFNDKNGSYSLRIRKNYYIKANSEGAYAIYYKGEAMNSNGSGYYAVSDDVYVSVDADTGSYALLELVNDEYKETQKRIVNSAVYTDTEGDFVIRGYETTAYDPSLFAGLISSAGYTITSAGGKLSEPEMKDGKIDFAAYGLAECIRTDESGVEYNYKPAYYILTDLSGNVHKVTVGDKIVSGAGYYMKYESLNEDGSFSERQAVYIRLDNYSTGYTQTYDIFYYYSITDTLLAPVEKLVTPMALYPVGTSYYYAVENFTLMVYNQLKSEDTLLNDDPDDDQKYYDNLLSFSYLDSGERKNTHMASIPYVMNKGCQLYGYEINTYSIDSCLMALADLDIVGVSHLGVDDQDLVRYGLDISKYIIYFEHPRVVNNEGETSQMILISELTANDTYYVYSQLYDMIVEVKRASLQFLNWKSTDWLTKDFYTMDLGFSDSIKIESGDYWANFDVKMTHNLTATITTGTSSNFAHTVVGSDDRKTHILTLTAKIYANLTSSAGDTTLLSVDFETLDNYYRYSQDKNALKSMTATEIAKLEAFMENVVKESKDGTQSLAVYGLAFTDNTGRDINVFVYFLFESNGEITASIAVNEENPSLVFSRKAYDAYEKVIFSAPDVTESDKRTALDFYLSSNVSTNVTNAFEEVIATNSLGETTVYTKEKIVKTLADGSVITDYGLGTSYKVFFDVGDGDLIGIGKSWVRFYDMDSKEVANGGYKEIKDTTYTFEATGVTLYDSDGVGIEDGTLGGGKYTVTVTSDLVVVKDESGKETRYLRYTGTQPFSSFYSSLLWASYEGFCDISEEEKQAYRESDDSECQMKLTIETKVGKTFVYKTYQYSERRAYITLNGEGDFFVMRSFIDKIINSSKTIFDGTNIDPKDKY